VSLINLIDKKGSQKMIGTAFTNIAEIQSNKRIRYVWFDFHDECKNMKYENLKFLLRDLEKDLENFAWCEVTVNGFDDIDKANIVSKQNGVFRSNCMDCLDRTNVVQSVIARNILLRQLASVKLDSGPNGEAFQAFSGTLEQAFRNLWVKNADSMSILYSGTPAQKTDFTRLGKRTVLGMINDSVYGVQRYVINNFLDGSKQNTMDLILGKLSLQSGLSLKWKYLTLATFLAILVVIFFISNVLAKRAEGNGYWILFITALLLFGKLIAAYGNLLVDKPISNSK
jgi:hypothetical protein